MATRRDAREWAVQMLFTLDLNPGTDDSLFETFWDTRSPDLKARAFAERLVKGVRRNRRNIDTVIQDAARNWDVRRMAVVDRNVLRVAVFEMLHCADIPAVVSINEAVDMAKYFNSPESGRFVNGILDRVRQTLGVDSAPPA